MPSNSPPVILCIGGSDSSAGAGVQADLKTAAAHSVYACNVITAVTAQSFDSVVELDLVSSSMVEAQLYALSDQLSFAAIKLGMLGSLEAAKVVHEFVQTMHCPVVMDPVLGATTGREFVDQNLLEFYRSDLLALATIVTPNISEAARILQFGRARNLADADTQAAALLTLGCEYVLLKGGHLLGENAVDILKHKKEENCHKLSSKFITTKHTHGSGCTLATAIASNLALKMTMKQACEQAKVYIGQTIQQGKGLDLVKENGPLWHYPS